MPRSCQGRNAARRLVWSIGGWVDVSFALGCFGKDNLFRLRYCMRLFEFISCMVWHSRMR
jgi:hypothetical protein